jgi:hypothetical protein
MVESLDSLFRNVLDLSRFDAGALKPRVQVFTIAELFAHLEGEFRLLAEAKGLRFETRPVQARVQTDLLLLERLLRNLLSNAIRYTASGSVTLAARLQDATWRYRSRTPAPASHPSNASTSSRSSSRSAAARKAGWDWGLRSSGASMRCSAWGLHSSPRPAVGRSSA